MSKCQMIQYNMNDAYWEDLRAMVTFIYNRVPPATRIEGEPWISPLQKQYPKRVNMDMSKIRPNNQAHIRRLRTIDVVLNFNGTMVDV